MIKRKEEIFERDGDVLRMRYIGYRRYRERERRRRWKGGEGFSNVTDISSCEIERLIEKWRNEEMKKNRIPELEPSFKADNSLQ